MLELLRDPLWQFIGALLAVAALIGSFVIYQLQRQRKGVTYDLISRTHLLTVREELEGKLQVLYEGVAVKSLSLLVLRIWNSGNQPILSTDYERPISFCTGEASHILSAAVTEVDPSSLAVEIDTKGSCLTISPVLLNPSDALTLKLLVRDMDSTLCPDARIIGVKSIRRASQSGRLFTILATIGMIFLTVGFYLFFANLPRLETKPPLSPIALSGAAIIAFGYAVLIYALVKVRRFRIRLVRLKSK